MWKKVQEIHIFIGNEQDFSRLCLTAWDVPDGCDIMTFDTDIDKLLCIIMKIIYLWWEMNYIVYHLEDPWLVELCWILQYRNCWLLLIIPITLYTENSEHGKYIYDDSLTFGEGENSLQDCVLYGQCLLSAKFFLLSNRFVTYGNTWHDDLHISFWRLFFPSSLSASDAVCDA